MTIGALNRAARISVLYSLLICLFGAVFSYSVYEHGDNEEIVGEFHGIEAILNTYDSYGVTGLLGSFLPVWGVLFLVFLIPLVIQGYIYESDQAT